MKLNIKTYVSAIIALSILYGLYLSFNLGVIIFFSISFVFICKPLLNRHLYLSYFIIFLSFLIAYIARAFVLVPYPELYKYPWINQFIAEDDRIIKALWEVFFYFTLVSCGFLIAVKMKLSVGGSTKKGNGGNTRFFSLGWPLKYSRQLIILLGSLVALKFFVFLFTGAGMKGQRGDTGFAFILRLVPEDLIFIIVLVLFMRYRQYLSGRKKIALIVLILLMSINILLTGSKVFLILVGLCLFVIYLYEGYKIKLRTFLAIAIVGVGAVVVSFPIAEAIKYKAPQSVGEFVYDVSGEIESSSSLPIVDQVTGRFIGLDGFLVAKELNYYENNSTQKLNQVFTVKNTVLRIFDFLVPFVNLTNTMSSGKAIAVEIYGRPEYIPFAAAVGIFGSFKFMSRSLVWLLSLGFGWVIGWLFLMVYKVKDYDLRLVLFFFVSYFVVHSFMSGNFDLLIALLIIKVILLFAYIRVIYFMQNLKFR